MLTYREPPDAATFFQAVIDHGCGRGMAPCLAPRADASGANSQIPSEGGFANTQQFIEAVEMQMANEGDLLSRTEKISTTKTVVVRPAIDQTARTDGARYGGVQVFRTNEAATASASKPKFAAQAYHPHRRTVLIYATDEMLNDVRSLVPTLQTVVAKELTFSVEDDLIDGQGTDGPLGVLRSEALIVVTPDSGQNSSSVVPANLQKMMGRLWPASHRDAIWLMGLEAYNLISDQSFSNAQPVVQHVGNRRFILGCELLISEYPKALGLQGDVILIDPTEIVVADRGQTFLESMHVEFLASQSVFKFTWRVDGQLDWRTTLVPRNCSITTSAAVTLGAR